MCLRARLCVRGGGRGTNRKRDLIHARMGSGGVQFRSGAEISRDLGLQHGSLGKWRGWEREVTCEAMMAKSIRRPFSFEIISGSEDTMDISFAAP